MSEADAPTPQQPLGNFQYEIYARGLAGERPALPLGARELERRARRGDDAGGVRVRGRRGRLGADDAGEPARVRARADRAAHAARRVGARLSCTVLGTQMPAPVMLAPDRRAVDRAPRRRSSRSGARRRRSACRSILSTAASHTMEQVAAAVGEASRWYQLYWPRDRDLAESFWRAPRRRATGRSW